MTYAAEPICDALQAGFARLVFEGSEVAKSVGDCAETMGRILHQSPRYYDGTCLRMETQTYRIIAAEVMRRERRS
jgi:hypothetical protein